MPKKVKIDWTEFDKLAQMGCTLREVSGWFNCSEDTIERAVRRKHKIGFAEYIGQKGSVGAIALRRRQMEVAMTGNVAMLIWLGKNRLGQADEMKVSTENLNLNVSPEQTMSEKELNDGIRKLLGRAIERRKRTQSQGSDKSGEGDAASQAQS